MDIQKVLSEAAGILGPSGQEMQIAAYFAEKFRPFVDEVTVNDMHCVIAHTKGTGPKVMLCAHMDEISLMVIAIEDDGCLRLGNVGGVDPRILPASRVWVHGKEKLFGTIGALPPHLLTPEDRKKNYDRKDLYVDVGLPADKVRELVHVGDLVTFNTPFTELLNGQVPVYQYDIDQHQDWAAEAQVESIPTFIICDNAEEVWRQSGEMDGQVLLDTVDAVLGSVDPDGQ